MNWIIQIFRKFYGWIFGYAPSDFSLELFRNFMFAAGSTGIATVLTFGINILAARLMGPSEFGKWNLIGSWAEFLVIIPLFGLTTAIPRYLGASEEDSKQEILGSGFRIVVIASLVSFPILWFIQARFKIIQDTSLVNATFVYAIILTFFYLVQSFFQGLKQFKRLSILWVVSAFGFVGVVLFYLFVLQSRSYLSLYWGNVLRLSFVVIAGLIIFLPMLWKYGRRQSKQLMHFGSFSMLSVAAGFFSLGSIDNIMINHYLGSAAVGLYSAYYAAFSIFIAKILNSFLQVFLPMASGHTDHKKLLMGIFKIYFKLWILLLTGFAGMIRLLFFFYGQSYIFEWKIALALALNMTLYTCIIIIGYVITSRGIRGAQFGFFSAVVAAVVNVALNMLLIPQFGLFGSVMASLIATASIGGCQYFFVIRSHYLDL